MRLILVRHGETYENAKQITQGHFNSKLNENGIKQAKKVALRLADEKIDFAYSSDLDRAKDTLLEILKFHSCKYELKPLLREQKKGVYEGRLGEEIQAEIEQQNIPYHEYKPEGGERMIDVFDKMVKFFGEIKEKHKNETVLVVSHGGPIGCLLAYFNNDEVGNFSKYVPKNTSVTIVESGRIKTLNCDNHLKK